MSDLILSDTHRFLGRLGWPLIYKDSVGSVTWEPAANEHHPSTPAMMACLTVTAKMIRARLVDVQPTLEARPYLDLVWDLDGSTQTLKRFSYGGVDLPISDASCTAEAIALFSTVVHELGGEPRLDTQGRCIPLPRTGQFAPAPQSPRASV